MLKRQKIVVTGADGQLGKELKLAAASFPQFEFIYLSKEYLPIENFEAVNDFFTTHLPQYCINCAAYTAVDKAEDEREKAFLVNGEAVGSLAALCKKYFTKLIHISTDYVFDGTSTVPYKEDDLTNPQNVYGASKLEGEEQALWENPDTIIIRSSWIYSEFGKNFVKTILQLLKDGKDINVVNDQFGSPTYAADLAETICKVIAFENWQAGIFHYSNEGLTNWYDFALAIKAVSGYSGKINPVSTLQYPTKAKRPAFSLFDKKKIQQTFHVKLKPWKESLAICIAQFPKD